jgi:type VI secretion system protein ImpC
MKFEITLGRSQPENLPTPETPFRILLLGDLDARTSRNLTQPLADRHPVLVDMDTLEAFLKALRAEVQLGLPGTAAAPIRIVASGLGDLHPDRLYERMDLFAALRKTRQRLLDPATFDSAAAEVRAWGGGAPVVAPTAATEVGQPPAGMPARESDAETIERLLGRATPTAPSPGSAASDLIRKAVAPHVVAAPAGDQPALVASVDAAVAELMRRVLHDSAFQALESTWCGIDFLLRRLETNESLKVSLLNLSRAELSADLMASEDLRQSALFRILVESTVQSPGAEPWALLLGLYGFGSGHEDLELLGRLAKLAQAAGAPFVAAAGTELVLTALQNPERLATDKEWAALRTSSESVSLGLACPRFLLRMPYGRSTDPISAFAFEEFAGRPDAEAYLWGHPALAVGVSLGQMFAESGWEMSPAPGAELDDLPVHSWKEGNEPKMTPCGETWLKDAQAERLLEAGLTPFQSIQGKDAIRLTRLQSIHQPLTALAGRWL